MRATGGATLISCLQSQESAARMATELKLLTDEFLEQLIDQPPELTDRSEAAARSGAAGSKESSDGRQAA